MRAVAAKIEPLHNRQFSQALLSRLFVQSPADAVSAGATAPEQLQAVLPNYPHPAARTSLASELDVAEEVLRVLATVPDIEIPLEYLVPIFSPHLVVTVLEDPRAETVSAFRFFNWASRRPQFRSRTADSLILSRLRDDPVGLESAWECVLRLREAGVPMEGNALEALISAYDLSNMPTKVMQCYDWMVKCNFRPTTSVYNAVMTTLLKRDVFLILSAVYSQMIKTECPLNKSTFSILIDAYRREGMPDKALSLLDEMSMRGLAPSATVCNNTIYTLCKAGRVNQAMDLLNRMRPWRRLRFVVHPYAYNTIIDGYCKAGKIDKAFEILEEFQKEGFKPGVHVYTSLIDALFSIGKSEVAVDLCKEMVRSEVEPDCVLYTVLMKHLVKDLKFKEAFELLDEMADRGINPDTFCYNTLVKGLCNVGLFDRAETLIVQMSKNGLSPNDKTFNIFISGLCRLGLVREALDVFDEMEKRGHSASLVTFNALIDGLCKSGDIREAKLMLCKMELGRNQSVLFRVSQSLDQLSNIDLLYEKWCESGQMAKAYEVLQDLKTCGIVEPDVTTLTTLINHYCKAGDLDRACKLYEELPRRGLSPDDVTFSILINAFLRTGQVLKAEKIFDDMRRTGCKAKLGSLCVIMRAWCNIKLVSVAVKLWLDYLPVIEDVLSMEGYECISMARQQFDLGFAGDAVSHLINMDVKNASCYSTVYCTWLSGFCEAGKLNEALQIWTVLKKYNLEVSAHSCRFIIERFGREGWFDVAIDSLTYMIEKHYEIVDLCTDILFQKLCQGGKQEVAIQLASEMSKAGYDFNTCFSVRTKNLLHKYGSYLSRFALVERPGLQP